MYAIITLFQKIIELHGWPDFMFRNRTITIFIFGLNKKLDVCIIKDGGPPLLGRDFSPAFELEIAPVRFCNSIPNKALQDLLLKYKVVFCSKPGCCDKVKVKLRFKENATKPIFLKARPVPFALKTRLIYNLRDY